MRTEQKRKAQPFEVEIRSARLRREDERRRETEERNEEQNEERREKREEKRSLSDSKIFPTVEVRIKSYVVL